MNRQDGMNIYQNKTARIHERLAELYRQYYLLIRANVVQCKAFEDWVDSKIQQTEDPHWRTASESLWDEVLVGNKKRWDDNAPGRVIGSRSECMKQSLSFFIAFRASQTLRAVFPIEDHQTFRQGLQLFPSPGVAPGWDLDDHQVRRIMHGLVNFSFAMGTPQAGTIYSGMLMASLSEGVPLYSCDVTRLRDETWIVNCDGNDLQFRSSAVDEERHVGMISLACIPLQIDSKRELPGGDKAKPDILLGLISPFCDVFGPREKPVVPLDLDQSVRDELTTLITQGFGGDPGIAAFRLIDELLGGDEPRVPLDRLLIWQGRQMPGPNQPSAGATSSWHSNYLFQRVARIFRQLGNPESFRVASGDIPYLLSSVLKEPSAIVMAGDARNIKDAWRNRSNGRQLMIQVKSNKIHESLMRAEFQAKLKKCDGDDGWSLEPFETEGQNAGVCSAYETRKPVLDDLGADIADVIRNVWKHAGEDACATLTIDCHAGAESWCFLTVTNEMRALRDKNRWDEDYQAVLRNYWIVRQGHYPQLGARTEREDRHAGGLGLYALRIIAKNQGFRCHVNLSVPEDRSDLMVWETRLDLPFDL
jgi:hypothetical protein